MPDATRATPDAVRPLRTRVLRPHWTDREATFPEDDTAVHLAARHEGTVAAVGTVYAEPPPDALRGDIPAAAFAPGAAWRLRGMASDESVRGQGYGAAVLAGCLREIGSAGGRFLWCNARLGAVPFYEAHGLEAVGPEFDVAEIGPHVVMWRPV